MTRLRTIAAKLGSSDLPIVITGEVGTGRRTMAQDIARSRVSAGATLLSGSGFDGLPANLGRNDAVLVLHHLHLLDARSQRDLAARVSARGVKLVATAPANVAVVDELAALLAATTVTLPPLRERENSVRRWAELFVTLAAADLGRARPRLSEEAGAAILAHAWPGNLAEMSATIHKAVLLGEGDVIEAHDLGFEGGFVVKALKDAEAEFRMSYVKRVLDHFGGNRTQAARALGVDARTVFRYLERAKSQ